MSFNAAAKLWTITPRFARRFYYLVGTRHSLAPLFLPDKMETTRVVGGVGKGMNIHLNYGFFFTADILSKRHNPYLASAEMDSFPWGNLEVIFDA